VDTDKVCNALNIDYSTAYEHMHFSRKTDPDSMTQITKFKKPISKTLKNIKKYDITIAALNKGEWVYDDDLSEALNDDTIFFDDKFDHFRDEQKKLMLRIKSKN